ncbi:MAG: ABC transporter ATP-binding protein [Gammaproteobacteria bacterium SG8_47]|nr:MAG: ABC transporter ATP-binding protein [Gammaproteobacteria bacterium SG8_47]
MTQQTLIEVTRLSRYYGSTRAIHEISFEVKRGEVLGLLGPNGAGKSTTMQILTGNLAPSAGAVRINGIDILDEPKRAKQAIGYLPEQPPVYRELTVDEYLRYCGRLHGLSGQRLASALQRAKQRCGLSEVGHRLIGNLSKGYQQRTGIAQAILHGPDVVVLDEPTVGLDPIQIREIRNLIKSLGEEHSVILSTHILPEVQSICGRVQIISQGELVLNDSIEGLQQRMHTSSLTLGLSRTPELAQLRAVDGVQQVEALGENRFRVHYQPDNNPAERLAELAVGRGWGLHELAPERKTLEDVFVDLTATEPSVEVNAA